jgi:hypothetical protein
MRANLLCGRGGVSHLVDEDTRHSLPIGQMGNYQDYLKKQPLPLRELESAPVRQHMFGNPFKTNKNLMMMTDEVSGLGGVDEVQIVSAGGQTPPSGVGGGLQTLGRGLKRPAEQMMAAPPKRRKGPLPRDFQLRSPRDSPVYRTNDLDYVPNFLSQEMVAAASPPMVNGLKSSLSAGGKVTAGVLDLSFNSEGSAAESEELEPPALRDETTTAKGRKLRATILSQKFSTNEAVLTRSPMPASQTVSDHFNKNNNKTDFLRHEVTSKTVDTLNVPNIVEPVTMETDTSSPSMLLGLTSPDTPLQATLQQQQPVAAWQPNGQPEHHGPAAVVTLQQPRHRPESLNAFSKDVIGEILNLPPPSELPILPSPGVENSPDMVLLLEDSLPAPRDKKMSMPAVVRWEKPSLSSEVATAPVASAVTVSDEREDVTEEELRSFRLRNNNVRQLIYKEVKRPGRCHVHLWKMLEGLHGPPWVRKQFIHEVKQEALR